MRRSQARSTIVTSNRPPEDRGKRLGDVPAATALLGRVRHNAGVNAVCPRHWPAVDCRNERYWSQVPAQQGGAPTKRPVVP